MITRDVRLKNRLGLHARAASRLVQTAAGFESEIWLTRNGRRVNAKSIMGVLMLAAPLDAELTLECGGPDEQAAVDAIEALIDDRFGEDE
ncbi:MAG: HPr family phosphocarrier protein [Candidatus Wenzhouxiangella sp. M2_3B_020]